jgi:hypothetical protein
VAGRDWCGGIPTAEGGRAVIGEALRYPAALRAGGRGEAEPNGGKMRRRAHGGSSYLGEGKTSVAWSNLQ